MTETDPFPGRCRLVVCGGVRPWRAFGAVAWAVLCDLAGSAVADPEGWIAPVGAREVGASAGINKDTAARALSTLATAGLVTRGRVAGAGGGRRSGYRLHLPPGLEVCPADPDRNARARQRDSGSPGDSDTAVGPTASDSPPQLTGQDGDSARRKHDHLKARDAGAGVATDVLACQLGDESTPDVGCGDGGPGPDGAAEPLNGRQSPAGSVERRRPREPAVGPQDGAQGRLFDVEVAVTGGSEDGGR